MSRNDLADIVLGVFVVVAIAAAVIWYLTIYDTAKGKCERGDVNACIIWQAQSR
jgi:hypothetical protein